LQPNYFFDLSVPQLRRDSSARRAQALGMGLVIEADGRVYTNPAFYDRFGPYLATLMEYPDLRSRPIALNEGGGTLVALSARKSARDRVLYSRLIQAFAVIDSTTGGP